MKKRESELLPAHPIASADFAKPPGKRGQSTTHCGASQLMLERNRLRGAGPVEWGTATASPIGSLLPVSALLRLLETLPFKDASLHLVHTTAHPCLDAGFFLVTGLLVSISAPTALIFHKEPRPPPHLIPLWPLLVL